MSERWTPSVDLGPPAASSSSGWATEPLQGSAPWAAVRPAGDGSEAAEVSPYQVEDTPSGAGDGSSETAGEPVEPRAAAETTDETREPKRPQAPSA